jgi:flagellar motor switch protein FliN
MSEENESQELPEIDEDALSGAAAKKPDETLDIGNDPQVGLGLVMDVPLRLSVEVGSATLSVREVLALSKGSVVELNRMNGDPADVFANDRLIARGELTVQDDRVAIRITELVSVMNS